MPARSAARPLSENHAKFGAAARARRRALGFSQEKVGTRAGKSMGYISRIEAGTINVSLDTQHRLSAALEWPLWVLHREAHDIDPARAEAGDD